MISKLADIINYMKILYFTGTGNCLAIAKKFNAEILSIPQMIKNNIFEITDDVVGIIYPTYAFSVPPIIKTYFKKCVIKANYTFVIAAYGNFIGGGLNEMKKLLKSNNNKADYFAKILMVDNFLPFFDIDDQLALLEEKNVETNLNKIIFDINNRKIQDVNSSLFEKIFSAFSSNFISKTERYIPRMFSVNDSCIGCGICKKVCPSKNIEQTDNTKPIYKNNCTGCLSCIHNCPKCAIQMKLQKSKKRFRNSEVSLEEIIESNN